MSVTDPKQERWADTGSQPLSFGWLTTVASWMSRGLRYTAVDLMRANVTKLGPKR
jgi:hypothetical protein